MDPKRRGYLAIYLNDHLAGSTVGVELVRRARGSNEGNEFEQPLAKLCAEFEQDREALVTVMTELGIGRSRLKPVLGWIGEKLGRVKPNGSLVSYSPLSRVVELEGLVVGPSGKLRLWRLLEELVGEDSSADFGELARRAEDQRARAEELQLRAARLL